MSRTIKLHKTNEHCMLTKAHKKNHHNYGETKYIYNYFIVIIITSTHLHKYTPSFIASSKLPGG